jgi:hypothetical protein
LQQHTTETRLALLWDAFMQASNLLGCFLQLVTAFSLTSNSALSNLGKVLCLFVSCEFLDEIIQASTTSSPYMTGVQVLLVKFERADLRKFDSKQTNPDLHPQQILDKRLKIGKTILWRRAGR